MSEKRNTKEAVQYALHVTVVGPDRPVEEAGRSGGR